MGMFGKFIPQRKRKQDCLLFTEDNRVLEITPEALRGCVAEHKTQEAWELYPDFRIPKRGTNRLFQLVSERDIAPLSLHGNGSGKKAEERKKKTLSSIAQDSASEARTNPTKQPDQNKTTDVARWLVLILGVTAAIMAIVGLLVGQLSIGGGSGGGSIFATSLSFLGFFSPKTKGARKSQRNTLMLDPINGFGLEQVDEPKGHRWNYRGQPVYVMERVYQDGASEEEATLQVFSIPKDPGESPRKAYRGLTAWSKLTPIIFSLKSPLWEALKTVGLYVLCGALLLVIWLMFSSMVG